MDPETPAGPPAGGRRPRRHFLLQLIIAATALLVALTTFSLATSPAQAYRAQLNGGGTTIAPAANGLINANGVDLFENGTGSNGVPISTLPWNAPSGTTFNGFIFGSSHFYGTASNHPYTGALSGGFWGISSTGERIVFPYADDCSVHGSSNGAGPMYWTADSWAGRAEDNAKSYCSESGNPDTWQFTNVEDDYSTGDSTTSGYTTLELHVACDSGNCPEGIVAAAEATDLSANVSDSQSQPSNTLEHWTDPSGNALPQGSQGFSKSWYTTRTDSPTLAFNALDPSGICAAHVVLTGSNGATNADSGDLIAPPSSTDDAAAGEEFTSDKPCNVAEDYNWTLPSTLGSGTYTPSVTAENADVYEDNGFRDTAAPVITSANSAAVNVIGIDNTVPAVQIDAPTGTSQTATASVTAGPSGVNLACTVDGSEVTPRLESGDDTKAGTTTWDVPDINQLGVRCTATNNDVNAALAATAVDYSDAANVQGDWESAAQDVGVNATAYNGVSESINQCRLNDAFAGSSSALQLSSSAFADDINAQATAECWSEDNNSATYGLWVDQQTPTLTYTGTAAVKAQENSYVSGDPTIDMEGEETTALSGVDQIACTVNGQAVKVTVGADGGGDFVLPAGNGTKVIACTPTTLAGKSGTTVDETLKLDDPHGESGYGTTDPYGASPSIDNGADPYAPLATSDWLRAAKTLTITADHTGGSAPITSVNCTGGVFADGSSSATLTGPADAGNGITANLTIIASNGSISCTATDSAGDAFPLGTYTQKVDTQGPTGNFVAQSSWPTPDAIEVDAIDPNGIIASGVATVEITARNADTGTVVDLGSATAQGGNLYKLTDDPDGQLPAGRYKLSAVATDAAGNSSTINGSTVTFPLRQQTKLTVVAGTGKHKRAAGQQPATPSTIAQASEVVAHKALPAMFAHGELTEAAKAEISEANASAKIAKVTARAKKKTVAVPRIKLAYGQKLTLTGKLTDSARHGQAVRGAAIRIYAKANGSRTITLLHTVHTGRRGKWSYRVRAGVSRILYVTYPGNSRLRSATDEVRQAFSGKVTTSASGAFVAGHKVTLMGRVRGGHIPAGGVHLQIWYTVAGSGAPLTHWMDVTSQRNGRWRYSFRLNGYTAGLTYEFEARVRGQSGWPYRGATSRPLVKAIS